MRCPIPEPAGPSCLVAEWPVFHAGDSSNWFSLRNVLTWSNKESVTCIAFPKERFSFLISTLHFQTSTLEDWHPFLKSVFFSSKGETTLSCNPAGELVGLGTAGRMATAALRD